MRDRRRELQIALRDILPFSLAAAPGAVSLLRPIAKRYIQ